MYTGTATTRVHSIIRSILDSLHDLPRSNGTARLSRPAWPNSVEWSVVLPSPALEMMLLKGR